MKVMILAAGRGDRMRPLTDTCPKPLLKVGFDSLIGHHLRRLHAAGFVEVVINHAWLGKQIEATLGSGAAYGVNIAYSAEGEIGLETAGGIATALPLLGDAPFLVVNGDIFTDIDFQTAFAVADTLNTQHLAHLWLVDNPLHHVAGDFALLDNGRLKAEAAGVKKLTYSGVGVYHPKLFTSLTSGKPAKLAPLLREAMDGDRVSGRKHTGLWLDVGTPQRLAEAAKLAENCMSANSN